MPEPSIEATDDEAKKVLEETGMVAEQKVRDHFPDLPNFEAPPSTAGPILEISHPEPNRDFEDQVYEYAKKHNGQFSLHGCANDLGASPDLIQNALERLRETGRIVIE